MGQKQEIRSGIIISEEIYGSIMEAGSDIVFAMDCIESYKKKLKLTLSALDSLKSRLETIYKQISEEHGLMAEWVIDDSNREIVFIKEIDDVQS